MNRGKILILLLGAFFLLALNGCAKEIPPPVVIDAEPERPIPTTEGSLWPGETSRSTLFSDKKASRVGDIILVYLVERTSATNKASTRTGRDQRSRLRLSTGIDATPTELDFGGGVDFSGSGSTSRSETFYATISAMVSEVLPNGQLKIDGQRRLKINDEWQYIQVSGIVRPEDINYDNSILSSKIANAEIIYDGTGKLDRSQRAGWLGEILDWAWPF